MNRLVRLLVCCHSMRKINQVSRMLFNSVYKVYSEDDKGLDALLDLLKKSYEGHDQKAFERDFNGLQSALKKKKKIDQESAAETLLNIQLPRQTEAITEEEDASRLERLNAYRKKKLDQIGFKEKYQSLIQIHFPGE